MSFRLKILKDFRFEGHCEVCNDTVHTHFNCPICGEKDAPTSCYEHLIECFCEGYIEKFSCGNCGTEFKILSYEKNDVINSELVIEEVVRP